MHTACVWSEKNYRLQNIQLSKNSLGFRLWALGAWLQAWLALATSKFTPPGLEPIAQSQEPELGGEYRARTGDLLVANQALSQLS